MDSISTFELPNERVREWVGRVLGEHRFVSRFSHLHAKSELWRVEAKGRYGWLKIQTQAGKWAGEIHGLVNWASPLGLSPQVLGHEEDLRAVLLSEMPGKIATETDLDRGAEERLWRESGQYLSRLHTKKNDWFGATLIDGRPQGATQTDPVTFVKENIETRLKQGMDRGHWTDAERTFIVQAMEPWCAALAGERPTAIHRDFGPRNWLTDPSGQLLGVIDWEHSRWDVRAADLNRAWDDLFLTKPWLSDAFFEGYGELTAQLRFQIQALRLMGAVAGIVWSAEVGDDAYGRLNRDALHRLMQSG